MAENGNLKSSQFRVARGASGMTLDEIKSAAGFRSINTYIQREEHPEDFRLKEIEGIYRHMEEPAKTLFRNAVCGVFFA